MLVVDNFNEKVRHTLAHFFHVFKSCIGFVLSDCENEKNAYMFSYVFQKLCWFRANKLIEYQKLWKRIKTQIDNRNIIKSKIKIENYNANVVKIWIKGKLFVYFYAVVETETYTS